MARANISVFLAAVLATAATQGNSASLGGSELLRSAYPAESLAAGEQGTVEFAVDLDADARIDSCVVTRSSGYPKLDMATCGFVIEHMAFPRAQTADGDVVATTRTGKITWALPPEYRHHAARAPAPVQVTKDQLEAQRVVCKRSLKANSLVRTQAHCLTSAEWRVAQALTRDELEEFIRRTRNRP